MTTMEVKELKKLRGNVRNKSEISDITLLSVIVPCLNEEKNIVPLVERILKMFEIMNLRGEIILIDDGSSDGTADALRIVSDRFKNVVPCFHKANTGIETAWKTGLAHANAPIVCLIDADLQYLPEDITHLYQAHSFYSTDIVQGSRIPMAGVGHGWYPQHRFFNGLINSCFGMRSKDSRSGLILTRASVLQDILEHRGHYRYFQTLITVAARARGYSVAEIDVLFNPRRAGKSLFSSGQFAIAFNTLLDIARAWTEYRLFRKERLFLEKFLDTTRVPEEPKEEQWSQLRRWYFKLYMWLMPLHHWMITKRAGKYFFLLQKTQWLSPEQVERLQLTRLKALVDHTYHHVPYWKTIFDAQGLRPEDIRTIEDLQKIPFLEKKTIRERVHVDLMSNNHKKKDILRISTSGSTGEPLICYADKEQLEVRWAATLRGQEWTGYRFGDRCLRLWHQTIGMSKSQIIRERVDAWFTNRKFIPAYHIDENNIRSFLREIEGHKPVLIDGYAESFNFLSLYLKNNALTTARPLGVMTSAQTLPPQSRKTVEEAFKCKVYDKYGSREFSGIAYECSVGNGHHIVAESYIVEVLKDGKPALPGEMGEIVVTDLNNYCMPFIRYRIGDLARVADGPCTCGRGLPLLGAIEGRTQAIIIGMQNQYVPGTFFAHFFKEYDYAIRQYQIVQEKRGALTLRIVSTNRFTPEIQNEIIESLQEYVGPAMQFDVEFLDQIPLSRTGKIQGSVSRLSIDFQNPQ